MRQPAMANVRFRSSPTGYPAADAVMRGGILLACHHGLTGPELAYLHESFQQFVDQAVGAKTRASRACQASPAPAGA
jgi:CDP-6-deoxy-D-xylo-4-hexulose-3-dehydrase